MLITTCVISLLVLRTVIVLKHATSRRFLLIHNYTFEMKKKEFQLPTVCNSCKCSFIKQQKRNVYFLWTSKQYHHMIILTIQNVRDKWSYFMAMLPLGCMSKKWFVIRQFIDWISNGFSKMLRHDALQSIWRYGLFIKVDVTASE